MKKKTALLPLLFSLTLVLGGCAKDTSKISSEPPASSESSVAESSSVTSSTNQSTGSDFSTADSSAADSSTAEDSSSAGSSAADSSSSSGDSSAGDSSTSSSSLPSEVFATSVTISGPTSVRAEETIALTAAIAPENVTNKTLVWASDSTSATIDQKGVVTGVTAGEANITATCGTVVSSAYKITVAAAANYGTEDAPLSLSEVLSLMAEYKSGDVSPKAAFFEGNIDGEVKTATLSSDTLVYDFTLKDGEKSFTCYHVNLGEGIDVPESGDTVKLKSFLKKYNEIFETGSKDSVFPTVLKVSCTLKTIVIKTEAGEASATIEPLKSVKLVATAGQKHAVLGTVTWESLAPAVATVASDGVVTGASNGTAEIKATSGTVSASFTVTVDDGTIAVTSVTVTGENTVVAGGNITLTATKAPTDATASDVTWASSDATVAAIDTKGVVTAKKSGSTNITATIGGKASEAFALTVTAPNLGTLAEPLTIAEAMAIVDNVDSSEYTGDTQIAYVKGAVKTAAAASENDLFLEAGTSSFELYYADDPTGVTQYYVGDEVVGHGWLTKYNDTYEVKSKKIDGTFHNAVIDSVKGTLSSISLSGAGDIDTATDGIQLVTGQTSLVTPTFLSGNADVSKVTYTSDHPEIAKVEVGADGKVTVTAVSAGTAVITAEQEGIKGTLTYVVEAPASVESVTVAAVGGATSVAVGNTLQLSATVLPATVDDKSVTWESSLPGSASIDAATGLVTGKVIADAVTFTATSVKDTTKKGTIVLSVVAAATYSTYTYTLASGQIKTTAGSYKSGAVTWSFTATAYVGFDTNDGRGAQIGSSKKPVSTWTISAPISDFGSAVGGVKVNACTGGSATISINIGTAAFLAATALTSSSADYTSENLGVGVTTGNVSITMKAASKAMYIKSIEVYYVA